MVTRFHASTVSITSRGDAVRFTPVDVPGSDPLTSGRFVSTLHSGFYEGDFSALPLWAQAERITYLAILHSTLVDASGLDPEQQERFRWQVGLDSDVESDGSPDFAQYLSNLRWVKNGGTASVRALENSVGLALSLVRAMFPTRPAAECRCRCRTEGALLIC